MESDQDNGAPPKKSARIPNQRSGFSRHNVDFDSVQMFISIVTTIYVRKDEEKVYHALHLDSLTVHDFKLQVGQQ